MLPYENIALRSNLTLQELNNSLEFIVNTNKKSCIFKSSSKPYAGDIDNNKFKIYRIVYGNSFLPIITGEFIDKNTYREIRIKMQLNQFIFVISLLYILFALQFFFSILESSMYQGNIEIYVLIPLGMALFGYLLAMSGFKPESKKSKEDLIEIFEAELISRKNLKK